MRSTAFPKKSLEVRLCRGSNRIIEPQCTCLAEEQGSRIECPMSYSLSLQVTESKDTASSYRPQFSLLKAPLLQVTRIGLIIQRPLLPLEQRMQFEIGRAKLILTQRKNTLQLQQMGTALQLSLPHLQQLRLRLKLPPIVEGKLTQQVLPTLALPTQESHTLHLPTLHNLEFLQQLRVLRSCRLSCCWTHQQYLFRKDVGGKQEVISIILSREGYQANRVGMQAAYNLQLRADIMSFFQEQSNDSNLQYDNAAFLYFIASTLIVAAAATLYSLLRTLLSIRIPNEQIMRRAGFLSQQIANLAKWKRGKAITMGLFLKLALLLVLVLLTLQIYHQSRLVENKMKGFDPFEILGLTPGSTLREVKKAYRKLALQYHPDRNQGNPEAQAKFILISKSYECFTDQTKTANCFKYGNPDGAGSFRVGIGLPKFFIEAEYKWYVLPLVLSFFLVVVPCFMLNWSNRNKGQDLNGINLNSYPTLLPTLEPPINKYTAIAFIASYVQIYQHPLIQPISKQDRQSLEAELTRNPLARRPVLEQFNDRQLQAYWELYKYSSGMSEFSHPDLREVFEKLLEVSFQAVKPFAIQGNEGSMLLGKPDLIVRFVGLDILYSVLRFSRDYYNRSLTATQNHLWLTHLSLTNQERNRALQLPLDPIVAILHSKDKLEQLLGCCEEVNRDRIRRELSELPVYNCQAKVQVGGKTVQSVNAFDYIEVKFRVARQAGSGFCVLKNHPYPKTQTIYLVMTIADSLFHLRKIEFTHDRQEYIGKVAFRASNPGIIPLSLQFLSSTYYMMDIGAILNLQVTPITPEQENMRIEFHPEDINIEKGEKNFFEQLLDLQMDTEDTQLSDSESQKDEGEEGDEKPLRA